MGVKDKDEEKWFDNWDNVEVRKRYYQRRNADMSDEAELQKDEGVKTRVDEQ